MKYYLVGMLVMLSGCMGGIAMELAGNRAEANKVNFTYFIRGNFAIARINNVKGIVRVSVRVRFFEKGELIDERTVNTPVFRAHRGYAAGMEALVKEPVPEGVDKVVMELISVDYEDDFAPDQ